jgi:succinoglycan biosynthesis transport protein ExoP
MNQPAAYDDPPAGHRGMTKLLVRWYRLRALVKKFWWIPVLTAFLGVAVQVWRFSNAPTSYVSTGKMNVTTQVNLPEKSRVVEETNFFYGTQIELMQSAKVQSRASERIQVKNPGMAGSAALSVSIVHGTSIFVFRAEGTDPAYTRAYVDACMEEYINLKKEMRQQSSDQTGVAVGEQISRVEKELSQAQDELFAFQQENNVVVMEDEGNTTGNQLISLNNQVSSLKTDYQLLENLNLDQMDHLAEMSARAAAQPAPDPAKGDGGDAAASGKKSDAGVIALAGPESDYLAAKKQLQMMDADFRDLSRDLKPEHPKLVRIKEEMERMNRMLDVYKEQTLQSLTSRRESLKLQIENLQKVIAETETKSLGLNRKLNDYKRLKEKVERLKADRNQLTVNLGDIDKGKQLDQDMVAVFEPATAPYPIRPNLLSALLNGMLLGGACGLGILFLLDRVDDRISSLEDLNETFDEPLIGQIPYETAAGRDFAAAILQPDDSRSAYAESFRNLRSSILYMAVEDKERPRMVMITASVPDEGKSVISCNLAATMAQGGNRVLLVDADMRCGVVEKGFKIKPAPGLSNILMRQMPWKETVQSSAYPNLWIIPRGDAVRGTGELLLGDLASTLFKEMREAYDFVVVDTGPVMATDDTATLAPRMDGVLFVVRASSTSASLARNALQLLYQRQVNVLGLILNQVDIKRPDYYHYRYHEYYAK